MLPTFELFGLTLRTWPLVTIASAVIAGALVVQRSKKPARLALILAIGFPLAALSTILLDGALLSLGTGRAFHVGDGSSDFGALLFIAPYLWLVAPRGSLDTVAPAFPMASALGRVACSLHGCCAGIDGVNFPAWYATGALVVFAITEHVRKRPHQPGDVFAIMVLAGVTLRFPLEQFRAPVPGWTLALNAGQITCALLFIVTVAWVTLLRPATLAKTAGMNVRLLLATLGCVTVVGGSYLVLVACGAAPQQQQPAGEQSRAATATPAPAPRQKQQLRLNTTAKMVVVPLRPVGNVSAHTCELLTSLLLTQLDEVTGLKTVSRDDIEAMLGVEKQKELLGCTTTACVAEIGGALGADYVLRGEVGQLGTSYNLNFSAIRSNGATVAARASARVNQTEDAVADALPDVITDLVYKLNGTTPPAKPVAPATTAP